MSQIILSIKPEEATKIILNKLLSRRMRHVIEKRFGLKGGRRHTLESIGGEYKITRERVRQIESEALKHLRKDANLSEIEEPVKALENHINNCGGITAEHYLLSSAQANRHHPHLILLLNISPKFHLVPETDAYHDRWTVSKDKAEVAGKAVAGTVERLQEGKKPVSHEELNSMIAKYAGDSLGGEVPRQVVDSYLATSKLIRRNPSCHNGLASWPSISPRGIRDKAYLVLAKTGKPLHFRDVADAISKSGWSKKKAHPQTVHNELIKDSRFVLVGRGLYGLKEWGYEPGLVKDVLVSVLKQAGKPLAKDEVIRLVSDKRLVKPQTILLNLQNKSLFKRTDEGKYTLV